MIKTILFLFTGLILVAGCASRLEKAIGRLKHDDPSVRYLAVGELQELDDERTIPHLLSALHDGDRRVVRRAIRVLGDRGEVRAIYPLIERLADKNPAVWISASNALTKIGLPAVESLILLLNHEDSELVKKAVFILGEIGSRQAADPLMRMLRHSSVAVRMTAATALGRVKVIRCIPILIKALEDEDPRVQYEAAKALDHYRPYSIPLLMESLESASEDMVIYAVSVLAKSGTPEVIETLGALSDHPSGVVRMEAVKGLGRTGDEKAAEFLVNSLKDDFRTVQNLAADYLVKMAPGAAELLVAILDDGDMKLRKNAALTLGRIGDQRALEPLIKILSSKSDLDRQEAASVLGGLGDPSAVQPIIEVLGSTNPELSWHATEALLKIGGPAVPSLIDILKDKDPQMRVAANLMLLNLGTLAIGPLVGALKTTDQNIGRATEHLLLWIGLPAVNPLIEVINDEDPQLSASAKKILLKMGSRAVSVLTEALQYRRDETRISVVKLYGDSGSYPAIYSLELQNHSEAVRISIVRLLGEIGDFPAINSLVAVLDDAHLSQEAIRALDKNNWRPVHWIDRIHYQIAKKETDVLLSQWDRTYGILKNQLTSGDKGSIEYAVYALIALKGETIIPKLMELLKAQKDGSMAKGYVKPLIETLRSENPALRETASRALVEIGMPAVQPLIEALDEQDPFVLAIVMETLFKIGPAAVSPLEGALGHPAATVRGSAATLLGRMDDKRVIPSLENALVDWKICQQVALALDALGWIPQTPYDQVYYRVAKGHTKELQSEWDLTLETLMRDLRSDREKLTEYAVSALLSINPKTVLPKLKALLAHEGDITLAKAYFASGNSPLIIAALDWAINNGYFEIILNQ